MNKEVRSLAKVVWDYHLMHQSLNKADAMFVLCSNNLIVARYAAEVFLRDLAPLIVYSGGVAHVDDLLRTNWNKPEVEVFAEIGIKAGIPENKIIIENKATNTGENIRFIYELVKDKNLEKVILVQKPFMERRTYATFMKQWPGDPIEFSVTSPQVTYEEYLDEEKIDEDVLINIIVGDLQRIKVYPDRGFQIFQEIPVNVWSAWEKLVAMGYDKHLIK